MPGEREHHEQHEIRVDVRHQQQTSVQHGENGDEKKRKHWPAQNRARAAGGGQYRHGYEPEGKHHGEGVGEHLSGPSREERLHLRAQRRQHEPLPEDVHAHETRRHPERAAAELLTEPEVRQRRRGGRRTARAADSRCPVRPVRPEEHGGDRDEEAASAEG